VIFGEIALSGEVRACAHGEARLKEAVKLGFKRAVVPAGTKAEGAGLALERVADVAALADLLGERA
jgi:DNA repair protein RadA/Sms